MILDELIDICVNKKKYICIVGGGGKTTLMFLLARKAAQQGKKVIVSTTTHIMKPENNYAANIDEINALWKAGQYAVLGSIDPSNPLKLTFPDENLLEAIRDQAELILFEADGAKGFPCKIPADYEPVINKECDLVIGVMGMSALDSPMKECCFRFTQEGGWLNVEGNTLLDADIAVSILSSRMGTRKSVGDTDYVVLLNQCDDEAIMNKALKISQELKDCYDIKSVCCSLKDR